MPIGTFHFVQQPEDPFHLLDGMLLIYELLNKHNLIFKFIQLKFCRTVVTMLFPGIICILCSLIHILRAGKMIGQSFLFSNTSETTAR